MTDQEFQNWVHQQREGTTGLPGPQSDGGDGAPGSVATTLDESGAGHEAEAEAPTVYYELPNEWPDEFWLGLPSDVQQGASDGTVDLEPYWQAWRADNDEPEPRSEAE